mmetsp:Transcript_11215/g.19762  ORF Transcript_11215/g.19762 Transcript_11215/m.19762 type:complete len:83 (+) Transcript_11215:61-309(+)
MWSPQEEETPGYDPDWLQKYEAENKRLYREKVLKTAGYGYAIGQTVGTAAYVLQTQRVGRPAIGAGAVLGVCMSAGFLLRSL